MKDPYGRRWQCFLCGFGITYLHEPDSLQVRFANIIKDACAPTTSWSGAFAHLECIAEHIPRIRQVDFTEDIDLFYEPEIVARIEELQALLAKNRQ